MLKGAVNQNRKRQKEDLTSTIYSVFMRS